MALPTVHGIFRAGTDPELRFAPSGTAVTNFRAVASSARKNDQTQEWETTGEIWVSVTCFNALAEHVAENVATGQQCVILGKIQVEKFTTRDGEEREVTKVIADAVQPLPRRDNRASGAGSQQRGAPARDPWGPPPGQQDEPPF